MEATNVSPTGGWIKFHIYIMEQYPVFKIHPTAAFMSAPQPAARTHFIFKRDVNQSAKNGGYTILTAENWALSGGWVSQTPNPAKI